MKKFFAPMFALLVAACAVVDPSEEVGRTLDLMNQAYRDKDIAAFMGFVSKNYNGERDELKIAVENDFAGFAAVDYSTSVARTVIDGETGVYGAKVSFTRSARSKRLGTDHRVGDACMTFEKDDGGTLRLLQMSKPELYGLIVP